MSVRRTPTVTQYYCEVCGVFATSEEQLVMHNEGKKHKRTLALMELTHGHLPASPDTPKGALPRWMCYFGGIHSIIHLFVHSFSHPSIICSCIQSFLPSVSQSGSSQSVRPSVSPSVCRSITHACMRVQAHAVVSSWSVPGEYKPVRG